ncbi:coiled-coil domain-containing protein 22 homolog [Malaya genurostris]|uniref:coiled-coil domain-containing protein 22 homolog n=1 Tax=Malaya genurostris TaxID=325434 RepID=UPI0026F38736|nr:coiled-coil domain-containing protein 22 homolog [Malaya genurostris]
MDEIDNIIFHSLRQIGCTFDEEIKSLDDMSPSQLIPIVSKCITSIDSSLDLPKTLPSGMAQRFTTTASLAEACRQIGYRREIGYQTFLYSNVIEVRRVMMFLIERLPKSSSDESEGTGQPVDDTTELENRITAKLKYQLRAPWIPEFCRVVNLDYLPNTTSNALQARIGFRPFLPKKIYIPLVLEDEDSLVPSVIATNDGSIKSKYSTDNVNRYKGEDLSANGKLIQYYGSIEKLTNRKTNNISFTPPVKSVPISLKSEINPLESLQLEIEQTQTEIERLVIQCDDLKVGCKYLDKTVDDHWATVAKLKNEKKFKERTQILLEDPDVNVTKLEGIIAAGGERMQKLQDQWKAHRAPLLATMDSHIAINSNKKSKVQPLLQQIDVTHQKCEQLVSDLQTKCAMHLRLQKELEKLDKTVNRTAYTNRILEIIGNIRKQKTDIDKILHDTRLLQKDLNIITGQLDRQFTVTDDLIFRNAKKDEHSKRAYKLLVTLHSDCAELIGLVQETGSVKREIRDLEDQIENEKTRNTVTNLAQITNDVIEMKNESERLEVSIRRLEEASSLQPK